MAVNFDDYLNRPMSEMKRTVLPPGHYFASIKKWDTGESGQGKPMLKVQLAIQSADEDVDQTQLPESGLAGKIVSVNFLLAEEFGKAQIGDMIRATGVPYEPTQGLGTVLPTIVNQAVKVQIANRRADPNDPESDLLDDVKKFLSAA